MATIIRQGETGDGYDVRVIADADGGAHVLHFQIQPEPQALLDAIAAFELMLTPPEPPTYIVMGEPV